MKLRSANKPQTADELVKIAQQHRGRYLILLSDWLNRDGEWVLCNHLVETGRARWLGTHRDSDDGEPGPGIELRGRDFAELNP